MSVVHFDSHIGESDPFGFSESICGVAADGNIDTWDPEVLGKLTILNICLKLTDHLGGGISHYA